MPAEVCDQDDVSRPAVPRSMEPRFAMRPVVVFGGAIRKRSIWRPVLEAAFEEFGLAPHLVMDPVAANPEETDYVICQEGGAVRNLAGYVGAKAIFSLWAGVEWLPRLEPPAGVPVIRMVEDGMTQGMTDYVSAHVLRYHVDLDPDIRSESEAPWGQTQRPLATQRRVGIAGLGTLGSDAARALRSLGFLVRGWSRTPKTMDGVTCYAGMGALPDFLADTEILVLLLPLTRDTENLFGRRTLPMLPKGARIINAARGGLIDDRALIEALDSQHLAHATLDVFRTEPLPADHPFRAHPRITVTPHIASITRPETAARSIAQQIRRGEDGMPFENVYDPLMGY